MPQNRKNSGSTAKKRSSSGAKKKVTSEARGRAASEERSRIRLEIASIVIIAVGAFLIFALFSDASGRVGSGINEWLSGIFGHMAAALPFFAIAYGGLMLLGVLKGSGLWRVVTVAVIFVVMCLVLAGRNIEVVDNVASIIGGDSVSAVYAMGAAGTGSGVLGSFLAKLIAGQIGIAGLYILCIALLIVSGILLAGMPMSKAAGVVREKSVSRREERQKRLEEKHAVIAKDYKDHSEGRPAVDSTAVKADAPKQGLFRIPSFLGGGGGGSSREEKDNRQNIIDAVKNDETYGDISAPRGLEIEDTNVPFVPDTPEGTNEQEKADGGPGAERGGKPLIVSGEGLGRKCAGDMRYAPVQDDSNYRLPGVELLSRGKGKARAESPAELKANAMKLEQALRDFKVEAHVAKVTVGPTVTRYEVEPDIGVKIQSIRSLEPDLALKLEVKSVRVVPMPGQSVIGIEAYNSNTSVVTLREMIDSEEFREEKGKISFALGKNISGNRIIVDLKEMPHLLIAGTTGSGKSVCINSILLSILYRAKPSEVKLILIDPKVVELKSYNDLPHLLVPVVTDPERAAMALSYAVTIMNERYNKFAELNVRNLESYNERMQKDRLFDEVMPEIVIVIDELSDLMMVASAKVQESISRLAAMARAAGMHLIVATQQPLASILTSVIKANIPSRIAFAVSSNSASRVILDNPGAERLHGKGDMLFSPVGTREAVRVQGALVEENEVLKVVNFVKKQMDPDYSAEVMHHVDAALSESVADDEDDLFIDAVEMVAQAKQASVSMLQRRFRIGYNRAARLVDMMEERGIVAPSDGTNKPRRLIMSEAQINGFLASAGQAYMADESDFASQYAGGDKAFSGFEGLDGFDDDARDDSGYSDETDD